MNKDATYKRRVKELRAQRAEDKYRGKWMTGDDMRRKGIRGWQNCDPKEYYLCGMVLGDAPQAERNWEDATLAFEQMSR